MNERERVLYIHGLLSLYDGDYLENQAPMPVITELLEMVKSVIALGIRYPLGSQNTLQYSETAQSNNVSCDILSKWQIGESPVCG